MKTLSQNIKPIIAIIIVVMSFIYFFVAAFLGKENTQTLIAIVGALSGIIGYYFGSSSGSAKNQETIHKLSDQTIKPTPHDTRR